MRAKFSLSLIFVFLVLTLTACSQPETSTATAAVANPAVENSATATHAHEDGEAIVSSQTVSAAPAVTLNPNAGGEIGATFEAYLSPHQEPGEEKDTPAYIPPQFLSTTPSLLRSERDSRGHGLIRFSKDLSVAYVDVKIEGVNLDEINMFHIHCGQPDHLGPILVNFADTGDIKANFEDDGVFSAVITNEHIEKVVSSAEGIIGAYTAGCPIDDGTLSEKAHTISSMRYFAENNLLYFNLHTTGQTYFGDMRGQVYAVEP